MIIKETPLLMKNFVKINVDAEKCVKCNKCLEICPLTQYLCFESLEDQYMGNMCIECCSCLAVCPEKAIRINDHVPDTLVGKIPSIDEALDLVKFRRTTRAFKKEKVKREDWDKLLEAVKYCPTGHNAQDTDIMIIESPEILQGISKICMELVKLFSKIMNISILRPMFKKTLGEHPYNTFAKAALFYEQQVKRVEKGWDPALFHAPALMLFIGPKTGKMNRDEADFAAQAVTLCAPTLGLGTCHSGLTMVAFEMKGRAMKKIVKIPKNQKVYSALLVGYAKSLPQYVPYRKARNVYYL
ncbi:MAG: nitroreductase family protein [Candidatus Hodarchaeota archaeon]